MTLVAAIHQPQYLPWLAYFDKADQCDVFVYLDNVQYQRAGFQNRNQIKTHHGPQWLTIPVTAHRPDRIDEVRIANGGWSSKHTVAVRSEYARAPYLSWFLQELQPILCRRWEHLVDVNLATTAWFFERLGIRCRCVRASELGVAGSKNDLIIDICRAVGADVYLSGTGARVYQDDSQFKANGIQLQYQSYGSPRYEQQHRSAGFLPDLSALDVVLNVGPGARDVLLSGRQSS